MKYTDCQTVAKSAKKRQKKDWDLVIVITGEEGVGKSTLALILAILIDLKFNLKRNLIFSPTKEKMAQKIQSLPRRSCIVADEAIKILYKMEYWSGVQKYLNKLFAVCRDDNHVVILCIPNFQDLNKYFRSHRAKLWFHVIDRGTVVAFKPHWNPFSKDHWYMDENERLVNKACGRKKASKFRTAEKVRVLRRSLNFAFAFRYDDLEKSLKKDYLELKREMKYKNLGIDEQESISQREKKYREAMSALIRKLLELNPKMKQSDIVKLTPLSRTTISTLAKTPSPSLSKVDKNNLNEDKVSVVGTKKCELTEGQFCQPIEKPKEEEVKE